IKQQVPQLRPVTGTPTMGTPHCSATASTLPSGPAVNSQLGQQGGAQHVLACQRRPESTGSRPSLRADQQSDHSSPAACHRLRDPRQNQHSDNQHTAKHVSYQQAKGSSQGKARIATSRNGNAHTSPRTTIRTAMKTDYVKREDVQSPATCSWLSAMQRDTLFR